MMELIQQLEAWQQQIVECPDARHADLDVAKRLLKHGIEAHAEIARTARNRDMWKAQVERQAAQIEQMRALLSRYRDETPLGHQPHMIAHLADEVLGRNVPNANSSAKPAD